MTSPTLSHGSTIVGMSDDDATMAGALPDTELAGVVDTLSETPLAYSEHTGTIPVADYEPSRTRWWPVAALVAVILAVTGGAAGAILWLGHHPGHSPAADTAAEEPTATPGPLNGVFRVDVYDSQRVVRHSDGTVSGGGPQNNVVDTGWWAIRSACEHDVCTASTMSLRGDLHDQVSPEPLAPYPPAELTLVNGEWRNSAPDTGQVPCIGGLTGEDTWELTYALMQLPDGSLTGDQVNTITTNECQSAGTVITIPMSATRTGDVPSTVKWNE